MSEARLAAIRYRLTDTWPDGEGIECRPGKMGGKPCLKDTRWPVTIWHECYIGEDKYDADATDAGVLEWWSWLTPEQVAAARTYVLANLPLFDARHEGIPLHQGGEELYRADVGYLLDRLAAAEGALAGE